MSHRRRSPVQQTSQGRSKFRHAEPLKEQLEPGDLELDAVERKRAETARETRTFGSAGKPVHSRRLGVSVVYCAGCNKAILGNPGDRCETCSRAADPRWVQVTEPEQPTAAKPRSTPHLIPQPREVLSRMGPTWKPKNKAEH